MKGRSPARWRAWVLGAVAAAVLWGATLSGASLAETLTISGTVTDSATSAAVPGVCVIVGRRGEFCWTTTNAAGSYLIDVGSLSATAGMDWEISFIKGGYATASVRVTVNGAETVNVSVTPDGSPASPAPPPCEPTPPFTPGCFLYAAPTGPQTFTVYLPNVVKTLGGPTGWHTPFIVQNVGTESTSLSVAFYDFSSGAQVATRSATVQPGRSFVDSPRDEADLPDGSQFSVVITATGAPVVAVVNEHQGPGAGNEALSYSGISSGSTTVYLPLVAKMADGWLTTLIMQNVGTASTTVTASFVSLDGMSTATITRSIDPGRSAFIDPRVEAGLQDGVEYSATLTATQNIAVVANNHHDLPGTTPVMGDSYNGLAAGSSTTTYLPYLAKNTDGVGRTSRVIVQNAGTTAATPAITLYPFGGGASSTVSAGSIAPGAALVFTLPGADGEYSATISGGKFAAVATAISDQTAMYYTSTSTPVTKLFVPNVTRKLTANPAVDPGWNTPVLIQSATATSATLTWYSFATGTLVTTQSVTLTAGRTLRVDPASVDGLSDNNQYAVVIQSTGTVVAIVTELNLVGGDDAMIYKGFPAP